MQQALPAIWPHIFPPEYWAESEAFEGIAVALDSAAEIPMLVPTIKTRTKLSFLIIPPAYCDNPTTFFPCVPNHLLDNFNLDFVSPTIARFLYA
jgi:hypothetical protein